MGDLTALANERFSAMSHFEIVKKNGSSGYLFFDNPGILPCKVVHKSETVLFVCFFLFSRKTSHCLHRRVHRRYWRNFCYQHGKVCSVIYFTVMKTEKLNAEAIKTLRDDTQHILGTHEHG